MLLGSMLATTAVMLHSPSHHLAIPVLGLIILLAYVLPWRLPTAGAIPWIIRGTLLFMLILTAPERKYSRHLWYLDPAAMSLVGMCLLAELTLQHWSYRGQRLRLGGMLSLVAGMLATATCTTEANYMPLLAPVFVLSLLGALRAFRPLPGKPQLPVPPRHAKRRLLQGTALALALLLGFTGVGLIKAYRNYLTIIGAQWMMHFAQSSSVGLNGNEQLGTRFNTTLSNQRALRITGTNTSMHLRALAFDTYDHGSWYPRYERRKLAETDLSTPLPADVPSFQVERLEDSLGLLYLPLHAAAVQVVTESHVEMEAGYRRTLTAIPKESDTCIYKVTRGFKDTDQGFLSSPPTPEELASCLVVPDEISPWVKHLALTLKQNTPQRSILSVIAYLQSHHTYSLNAYPGKGDAISDFLQHRRAAHCQYFASAAAMLLRCCNVPTRYVTGYYAHEYVADGEMIVRQRDAHAWVEAWVAGVEGGKGGGWVTVEATPASGNPNNLPGVGLLQHLRDFTSDFFAAVGKWIRSLSWQQVAVGGASLALLALLLQVVQNWRSRRKAPPPRPYSFPAEDYQQIAEEFEHLLRRIGDAPATSIPWSEHLYDQATQGSHRHTRKARLFAARAFVEQYNRIRFGNPNDPAAVAELRRLLQQFKETQ